MSGYVVSPAAEDDIAKVYSHIGADNVHAAERLFIDLYQAFRTLADMPGLGHTRWDLTRKPLLFWPVRRYLVIYRALPETIEIARVLHGNRDVASILG